MPRNVRFARVCAYVCVHICRRAAPLFASSCMRLVGAQMCPCTPPWVVALMANNVRAGSVRV